MSTLVSIYAWNLHHWYLGLAFVAVCLTVLAVVNYRNSYVRRHHRAEARDYPNGMTRTEWIAAMKAKVSAAQETRNS